MAWDKKKPWYLAETDYAVFHDGLRPGSPASDERCSSHSARMPQRLDPRRDSLHMRCTLPKPNHRTAGVGQLPRASPFQTQQSCSHTDHNDQQASSRNQDPWRRPLYPAATVPSKAWHHHRLLRRLRSPATSPCPPPVSDFPMSMIRLRAGPRPSTTKDSSSSSSRSRTSMPRSARMPTTRART